MDTELILFICLAILIIAYYCFILYNDMDEDDLTLLYIMND